MDGFSVASLTSAATSIHQRSLSAADEIRCLQRDAPVSQQSQSPLSDLVLLAGLLEKASADAEQLSRGLGAAQVVAPGLQGKLKEALTASEAAVAGLAKQLMRLDVDNLGGVYVSYIRRQQHSVRMHNMLFQYCIELVALYVLALSLVPTACI